MFSLEESDSCRSAIQLNMHPLCSRSFSFRQIPNSSYKEDLDNNALLTFLGHYKEHQENWYAVAPTHHTRIIWSTIIFQRHVTLPAQESYHIIPHLVQMTA